MTVQRWNPMIGFRKSCRARVTRGLKARALVGAILALLAVTGSASGLGSFPPNGDSVDARVERVDGANRYYVWVTLSPSIADFIQLKETTDIFGSRRWGFTLPEGRSLHFRYGEHRGCSDMANNDRQLACWFEGSFEINVRLNDLNDTFVSNPDFTWAMNIFGDDGGDYLRTARGRDNLNGGTGNDVLRSWYGADKLYGGAGDDILDGGDGADLMDCGEGADTVQYQGRVSALTITLDNVANDGATSENDTITNCENVEAWNGADTVVGSSGANRLDGRDGNDNIKGGGGNDRLSGGSGKDTLAGGSGNDTIYGDADDDTITGGGGTDTVYGGGGSDTINVKDGVKDTVYCGAGDYDTVTYDAGIDEIDIGTCERR